MESIKNLSRTTDDNVSASGVMNTREADGGQAVVWDSYRYFIAILAVIGFGIMTYLTYIRYANVKSFCDISAEVSCDVVNTSVYSEVFGIPVSVFGLFYFAIVLIISLAKRNLKIYQSLFFLTVFALIPSLYLTLMEVLFIKSFCLLCETSKGLMFLLLLTSWLATRQQAQDIGQLVVPVIIAGLVVSGVLFFAQTSAAAKKGYFGLAEHMNQADRVYSLNSIF